jgi:Nucleotidyl transferase AbiEii toxin, Type IV TA system
VTQTYRTARAFRTALEERLKQQALRENVDLMRLRRQVAFQRCLARLFAEPSAPWILKGGHAFEVRLAFRARATRDIDLAIPNSAAEGPAGDTASLRDLLQDALELDAGDWFAFLVGLQSASFDSPPQGGARFPVEARLDSRQFATFSVDIGLGDVILAAPESVLGPDLLSFAGIPPARVRIMPMEQQFAEKVHAYSLPRDRANSRVKDLVDLLLLLDLGLPKVGNVAEAVEATFERRGTHPIPGVLLEPPAEWGDPYAALAADYAPDQPTLALAYERITSYWKQLPLRNRAE